MLLTATIFISSFLLIIYAFILRGISREWNSIGVAVKTGPMHKVTVVVAARNEEENIGRCVHAILTNKQPLSVLVVDDHSEDGTIDVLNNVNSDHLIILKLPKEKTGKKAALTFGIEKAETNIILTTDADCEVSKEWVSSMSTHLMESDLDFVAGPVVFDIEDRIINRYQNLDMMGMMGVTNYGIATKKYSLANGANMAFKKTAFLEVGGFTGNAHLASGDDLFLVQKIAEHGNVGFAKDRKAIVVTQAERKWSDLFSQRKRWATKSMTYKDGNLKGLLAVVFISNLIIPLLILISIWLGWMFFVCGITAFLVKTLLDHRYLKSLSGFFNREDSFSHFIISEIATIYMVMYSGLQGLLPGKYTWKNRTVK